MPGPPINSLFIMLGRYLFKLMDITPEESGESLDPSQCSY